MHRMISTAALALALAGTAAFAQQQTAPPAQGQQQQDGRGFHHRGHHRQHDPKRQTEMLTKHLNLSAQQSAQVEPILAARQQKMEALRADTSLTPDARRQQFMALHQESKQQLDAVLTHEQREQMKSMRHHGGPQGQWQKQGAPSA